MHMCAVCNGHYAYVSGEYFILFLFISLST